MTTKKHKIGWIGMGRMGYPMAEWLVKAGNDVSIWNRTKAKAEPLAAKGAKLVNSPADLAGCDILFTMVSTGKDVEQVYFGEGGVATVTGKLPKIFVECSSISVEESESVRKRLEALGSTPSQRAAVPISRATQAPIHLNTRAPHRIIRRDTMSSKIGIIFFHHARHIFRLGHIVIARHAR